MPSPLVPVILCGGSGTRLWPLSRKLLPKQFLPLATEQSLLQDTVLRLGALEGCAAPILIGNQEHRFMIAEQLREIGVEPGALLLEPVGRNTAPAVAVAAHAALRRDPGALLLVLPSDHVVRDPAAFGAAVRTAREAARQGALVTFGVVPTEPTTGFGYIEQGEPLAREAPLFRIRRFVEKPDLETARAFLVQGGFLWNSGMFVLPARGYLDELERLRPDIAGAAARAYATLRADMDFVRLDEQAFAACPAESLDYAVMEKTNRGAVVRADLGWSDVGSWSALWDIAEKDARGNAARGDVHLVDAEGCLVRSEGRLVSAVGVRDLVIVETSDAVLVAARDRAQEVRETVAHLDRNNRTEHLSHKRVYRPWGYYESVDAGGRYQVKRLMVKPGHALSLQRHRQRAEHWVVVAGRARVTRGEDVLVLEENQSTFIPLGVKHRLENPGEAPLFIVEVQSGAYLGEDDIERFEDRYNRG
ncbi:MAG: mannose-1-phosphate guanylyltransferase/mannose-6-phosphate isomerase [Betaproteobacteria bacterium]|nr:mannose-1-phosphate guanylyltransferase/mannose-6-phosphate isomerase [Betaproteobacteria bacterium]